MQVHVLTLHNVSVYVWMTFIYMYMCDCVCIIIIQVGGICNANWCTSNGVLIKLKDVPEMGYLTTDKPPRGEICVKTDSMIEGYYKNSHETTEKFQDGFFCTGDIGVMDVPGHVIIIDRKKNIFKLAQGEFVAPEKIEGLYESTSNFMEQVYVYGNIYRNNVLAVIVPHAPALIKWKLKQQTEDKSGTNDNELEQTEAKSNDNSAANNEETVGSSRASSEPDTGDYTTMYMQKHTYTPCTCIYVCNSCEK